ncbi:TetR/AcrR family transcriptional regulator [Stackebrandtia nassauensis]|uniref:Transcriptional regulator, TetR family n=1 Tax=Stackebrandtia nassauensis (strain DSM 44728 / CIP 108903 / NRRL B-16338 / NBRC 102104 / LLR-40K-21) TaxID=446470 RepID=D3Q0Y4_STANL|nr:TetR/AcrR family transcriptional regulator [Stackebrandtia nassauensis]ADD43734.1 transcriptional regulator, TetR family [Stackebrandtia nassauensis DSM 44728]
MGRAKQFDPDVVVDKAMRVFWRDGYAGTTPQRLVDELGIGRGSLYNAFGSKAGLYERALRRYYETETVRLIEILDGAGSPRVRVRAALDLVVTAALADTERRGCMAANAAVEFGQTDATVNHLVRRVFERQEAAFRGAIEEGQRAGEFTTDADASDLAYVLLTTINGIRVLAKANPDEKRLRGLAATALRALD